MQDPPGLTAEPSATSESFQEPQPKKARVEGTAVEEVACGKVTENLSCELAEFDSKAHDFIRTCSGVPAGSGLAVRAIIADLEEKVVASSQKVHLLAKVVGKTLEDVSFALLLINENSLSVPVKVLGHPLQATVLHDRIREMKTKGTSSADEIQDKYPFCVPLPPYNLSLVFVGDGASVRASVEALALVLTERHAHDLKLLSDSASASGSEKSDEVQAARIRLYACMSTAILPLGQRRRVPLYHDVQDTSRTCQVLSLIEVPEFGQDGIFAVPASTREALRTLPGPFHVASICGPMRSGKSFLLSKVLQNLTSDPNLAFTTASGTKSVTRGAWFCAFPHGQRGTTILIDLEGSDSTERERGHDLRIFNFGFILSSVVMFNQKGLMNNAATLDLLECCTQVARHVTQAKTHTDKPSMIFCWRDFEPSMAQGRSCAELLQELLSRRVRRGASTTEFHAPWRD